LDYALCSKPRCDAASAASRPSSLLNLRKEENMPTTRRRTATWPTSHIWARTELDRKRRRLDRRNCSVEQVLDEMRRRGAVLLLSFSPREHWRLSTGIFVPPEIARAVVNQPSIVSCGDALFAGATAQTFRFVEAQED
jgi:hypothetical protein